MRVLKHLLHLPGLRLVALDRRLGRAAALLAASTSLRGADAVYAALAQHLSIPLVTWDEETGQRAAALLTVMQPRGETGP
jgi:predicted nucleic acid-binding protein